jgi:hypothetical protein
LNRLAQYRASLTPLLVLVVLILPAHAEKAEVCPWMNAPTAGGFLQGAVTSNVTRPANKFDATCEFVRSDGKIFVSLRIEVTTMKDTAVEYPSYISRCGSDETPLRAIGNEALVCSLKGEKHLIVEQVVSRVRERAFIVRVSSNASPPEQSVLREKARQISEQVAGSLF